MHSNETKHVDDLKLQALRITKGWTVVINKFYDLEQEGDLKIKGLPNDNGWVLFEQDLLLLRHERRGVDLDLGWVPYWDPGGKYLLNLYRGSEGREPLMEFETASKEEVVEKINEVVRKVTDGAFA